MSESKITCARCRGSGEIGVRNPLTMAREAPGPVPDDARGWHSMECPDCRGRGEYFVFTEDECDEDD